MSASLVGHCFEDAFTDMPKGYLFGSPSSLSRTQLSSTSGMCHISQAIEFAPLGGCQKNSLSERRSIVRNTAGARSSKLSQMVCACGPTVSDGRPAIGPGGYE